MSNTTLENVCGYLHQFAPLKLAEEWDNVGLLVGDRKSKLNKVMTCLTITPESLAEAIRENVDLIVTHHPFPFRSVKRITRDNTVGSMLLDLIAANIAVYSPHTSFDSATEGINQQIAEGLQLQKIKPLTEDENDPKAGTGRRGELEKAVSPDEFLELCKTFFNLENIRYVLKDEKKIKRVAIGCGSAGQFMGLANKYNCDAFVTGETNFHTCLEAEATDTLLVLTGHFSSERFAIENLATRLAEEFSDLEIWSSKVESDPVKSL